jgi:uncharacterized protein (DUF1697 family)
MPTYVVLLRAVNVGGYGKLAMADFRKLLEELGFKNVQTYIQSGNAVFDAKGSAATVAKLIADALEKHTGAPVDLLIRTHEQLGEIIDGNPFAAEAKEDGARVHAGFLFAEPPKSATEGLDRIVAQYPDRRDRYYLRGSTLYLHLPDGAADTKFAGKALERALGGTPGTGRNWNTVVKLHAMSKR